MLGGHLVSAHIVLFHEAAARRRPRKSIGFNTHKNTSRFLKSTISGVYGKCGTVFYNSTT